MTGTTQQALNTHGPVHKCSLTILAQVLFSSFVFSVFLLLFFLFTSCSKNPVSTDNSIKDAGSRNYSWTSDILTGENLFYVDIWASDNSHIWVVGPTGIGNKRLQRYNGYYWQDEGNFSVSNFSRVNGADGDNVWAVTSWGEVWKKNTIGWQENTKIKIPGYDVASVSAVLVENESSVLVGGSAVNYNGNNRLFVCAYDGNVWKELQLPNIPGRVTKMVRSPIDKNTLYLEAQARQPDARTNYYFYELIDTTFKMIYYEPDSAFLSPKIRKIGNEVFFGIGSTLNVYQKGKFIQVLDWGSDTYNFFAGRSRNDLFTLNSRGIAHFNGVNLKQIYEFPNDIGQACQIVVNGDIVIVLANSNGNNIVYKGVIAQQ